MLDGRGDGGLPVRSASSDAEERHCASPCLGFAEMAVHEGVYLFVTGDLSRGTWYWYYRDCPIE